MGNVRRGNEERKIGKQVRMRGMETSKMKKCLEVEGKDEIKTMTRRREDKEREDVGVERKGEEQRGEGCMASVVCPCEGFGGWWRGGGGGATVTCLEGG